MKHVFEILSFLSDAINKLIEFIVASLLIFLSVLMILAVFYRYILNNSIYWSDEVSKILLVFLAFLGSTVAYKHSAHIGIDIITERLSKRLNSVLFILIKVSFLLFWALIFKESLKLMPLFMMQTTATLEIRYAYVFCIVPITSIIWLLHISNDLLRTMKPEEKSYTTRFE